MTAYPGFGELYEAEFQTAVRAAYAVSGDRTVAAEAAQEAFARALQHWTRLRDASWVVGWIVRTAMNHARREGYLRGALRGRLRESWSRDDSHRLADRADLVATIRTLPRRQREAIVLHYVADLPLQEVAEVMGLANGTVKAHLSRARESLRNRIGEQLDAR